MENKDLLTAKLGKIVFHSLLISHSRYQLLFKMVLPNNVHRELGYSWNKIASNLGLKGRSIPRMADTPCSFQQFVARHFCLREDYSKSTEKTWALFCGSPSWVRYSGRAAAKNLLLGQELNGVGVTGTGPKSIGNRFYSETRWECDWKVREECVCGNTGSEIRPLIHETSFNRQTFADVLRHYIFNRPEEACEVFPVIEELIISGFPRTLALKF